MEDMQSRQAARELLESAEQKTGIQAAAVSDYDPDKTRASVMRQLIRLAEERQRRLQTEQNIKRSGQAAQAKAKTRNRTRNKQARRSRKNR